MTFSIHGTPGRTGPPAASDSKTAGSVQPAVRIRVDGVTLEGDLVVPSGATAVVLFAHGSGSSRHSPRNRYVAARLQERQLGTLLFDLLPADEERLDAADGRLRFDVPLLARRLVAATVWAASNESTCRLGLGYFGASTGAAAALVAAAQLGKAVGAVVSRGGRPDLAAEALAWVATPTLLLVGSRDVEVLALNRAALAQLRCEKRLATVTGATHLFEEAGTLEQVASLAAEWFQGHLRTASPPNVLRGRQGNDPS